MIFTDFELKKYPRTHFAPSHNSFLSFPIFDGNMDAERKGSKKLIPLRCGSSEGC